MQAASEVATIVSDSNDKSNTVENNDKATNAQHTRTIDWLKPESKSF